MRRLILMVATLATLIGTGPRPAFADPASDLAAAQQQQQLIAAVRDKLGNNLADALVAQDQLEKSLKANVDQQAQTRQKIQDADSKIAALDADLVRRQLQIDATNRRIEIEKVQIRSLARAIYVQPGSILVMLGESHSLGDLITRIADLSSAGGRAKKLKVQLNEDYALLQVSQVKQQTAREQQAQLRVGLEADLAKLVDLQAQQEDSKQKLAANIEQTRNQMTAVNSQSAALSKQIADILEAQQNEIIAAAMQQVWDQVRVWQGQNSVGNIPASAGHSVKYRFIWPEPMGTLTQSFGPSTLSFEPAMNGFPHFHAGIDIAEPVDSPILAADDGVVALVGSGPYGYGNYVVLAHTDGLTTLYGHMNKALVKPGDRITQGQVIGLEGSTGNSTGPHVHFELRIAGKPVDPAPYLPPGGPSPFKQ